MIQGAQVQQDYYVIADRFGTDFVAAERIEEVLDLAEKFGRRQNGMLEAVRSGRPVSGSMHDKQFAAIHDKNRHPQLQRQNRLPHATTRPLQETTKSWSLCLLRPTHLGFRMRSTS